MEFVNKIDKNTLQSRKEARKEDLRGQYFRDTTAIIHSYPFRRLKHKTQVFFAPRNDHICTRIEHVMHVATISASICRALDLDSDLAWAISLGHDLGHTPFGHVGEHILSDVLKDKGGFAHEIYSLRVVDYLINYGKGLNLTYGVRDGIINHCGEVFERSIKPDFEIKDLNNINERNRQPSTWEGSVVRMSDKIAYLGRDLEDAMQLRLIKESDIPAEIRKHLGKTNSEIINNLVTDLINESRKTGEIAFSENTFEILLKLKDFNYKKIYNNPFLSNYHKYFHRILTTLHSYLTDIFKKYKFNFDEYKKENNVLASRFGDYCLKMKNFYEKIDQNFDNLVTDYIAGMTDDFAIDCITEIMVPKKFGFQFNEFLL